MQTEFSAEQLRDAATATSAAIIRKCVHCGFCTATCPTYVLLGDELDSPRGRIYLMKGMLERQGVPSATEVKHVDRCLSCLACVTTCPSGVDYRHLVDHARAYIEQHYRRPWHERATRALLAAVLPRPDRFRAALRLARWARAFAPAMDRSVALRPLAAMLRLAPARLPAPASQVPAALPRPRGRIALLQGCAEPVLQPSVRDATVRLLGRAGYAVVFVRGEACCGALVHHLGREDDALAAARRNVDAWMREIDGAGLQAIAITASGCGSMVKDYGYLLRGDPAYAEKAARVSALAKDIGELLASIELPPGRAEPLAVAHHPPCTLQHGQRVGDIPVRLLAAVGFAVSEPAEKHLCCGSAGTYNLLQPALAARLGDRKVANLERMRPDVIATGNIGCAVQIAARTGVPVVHTVELLDWATGGPRPPALGSTQD